LKLLVVTAHPDDETFGPGATLAKYAAHGVEVVLLCATRGESGKCGIPDICPGSDLGSLRVAELEKAASILGIKQVENLGYPDGGLCWVPGEELVGKILARMEDVRPGVVLTFPPGGISGHPDHVAVSRATTEAFHRARQVGVGVERLYYFTIHPGRIPAGRKVDPEDLRFTTLVDVKDWLEIKIRAVEAHRTQSHSAERIFKGFPPEMRRILAADRFYRVFPPLQEENGVQEYCLFDRNLRRS